MAVCLAARAAEGRYDVAGTDERGYWDVPRLAHGSRRKSLRHCAADCSHGSRVRRFRAAIGFEPINGCVVDAAIGSDDGRLVPTECRSPLRHDPLFLIQIHWALHDFEGREGIREGSPDLVLLRMHARHWVDIPRSLISLRPA